MKKKSIRRYAAAALIVLCAAVLAAFWYIPRKIAPAEEQGLLLSCDEEAVLRLSEPEEDQAQTAFSDRTPSQNGADMPSGAPSADGAPAAESPSREIQTMIRVHVCGAVCQPGVYAFPLGSRAEAAVEAAGGFTEEADREFVNLAAFLQDGEQLCIPTEEEAAEARELLQPGSRFGSADRSPGGQLSPAGTGGKVDLNKADKQALMSLPGIGEKLAERILDYRSTHGPFRSAEDLIKVPGIKEKAFGKLSGLVTAGEGGYD